MLRSNAAGSVVENCACSRAVGLDAAPHRAGVRRETAGASLKAAGLAVRPPGLAASSRRSRCWPCWRRDAQPHRRVNVLSAYLALAGFQVSIYGRFWVSTEG